MKIKKMTGSGLRVFLISIVLLMIMVISSSFAVPAQDAQSGTESGGEAQLITRLWLVNLVNAVLISLVISHTQWEGWPLILGLSMAFYGTQTVVGQLEAIFFLTPLGETWGAGSIPTITMPLDFIVGQFIVGAGTAIIGIPIAISLFGKLKGSFRLSPGEWFPSLGMQEWITRIAGIIALYIFLYFGFGYYIAWKNPAIQSFYQGTDPGSLLAQMRHVLIQTPTLVPLQAFRAMLWAFFSLPVVRMLRHKGWWGAVLTGLFISLPMNIPHIIPNPYMPPEVRTIHFIETASSTFLFGTILFWLLNRSHDRFQDLVQAAPSA